MVEAFYYVCHRFLKLCEKVEGLGLGPLYGRLRACDVVIARNDLVEHVEKPTGVPGHHFGWDLPNGPEVKPLTSDAKLKRLGCYSHADEVVSALESFLESIANQDRHT